MIRLKLHRVCHSTVAPHGCISREVFVLSGFMVVLREVFVLSGCLMLQCWCCWSSCWWELCSRIFLWTLPVFPNGVSTPNEKQMHLKWTLSTFSYSLPLDYPWSDTSQAPSRLPFHSGTTWLHQQHHFQRDPPPPTPILYNLMSVWSSRYKVLKLPWAPKRLMDCSQSLQSRWVRRIWSM